MLVYLSHRVETDFLKQGRGYLFLYMYMCVCVKLLSLLHGK